MSYINRTIEQRSDIIGALASGLCLVHCVATPFLFIAQSGITDSCHAVSPTRWSAIDLIFILITFFAVRQSGKQSSKPWMSLALLAVWALLTIIIFNEKTGLVHLPSSFKHIIAISLIVLHLYNMKFCKC